MILKGLIYQKYKSGSGIDADKLESHFSKKIIKKYTTDEQFAEVFFLDDKSGTFQRVKADKLIELVGSKIKIEMKDGLPRWSYNF